MSMLSRSASGPTNRRRRRTAFAGLVAVAAGALVANAADARADARAIPYTCVGVGQPGLGAVGIDYPVSSLSPRSAGSRGTFTSTYQFSLDALRSADRPVTTVAVSVPPSVWTDERMRVVTDGAALSGGNVTLVSNSVTADGSVELRFAVPAAAATNPVLPTIAVSTTIETNYFSHGRAAAATFGFPSITAGDVTGTNSCNPSSDEVLGTVQMSPPLGTVVTYPSSSSIPGTSTPTGPTSAPVPSDTRPPTSNTTTSTTVVVTRTRPPTTPTTAPPPTTTSPLCRYRAQIPAWFWPVLVDLFGIAC